MEQGGKFFVIENGTPVNPLTNWIRGYVEPTNRTITIDIGRFGREAMIVRLSSRETYRDDRQIYEKTVARELADFREELKAHSALLASTKKRRAEALIHRSALQSERAARIHEIDDLLLAASRQLAGRGSCGPKQAVPAAAVADQARALEGRPRVPSTRETKPVSGGPSNAEPPPDEPSPGKSAGEPTPKPSIDPFEEGQKSTPKPSGWVDPFAQ